MFRQLPQGLDNLTRGELAALVQKMIEEDLMGQAETHGGTGMYGRTEKRGISDN